MRGLEDDCTLVWRIGGFSFGLEDWGLGGLEDDWRLDMKDCPAARRLILDWTPTVNVAACPSLARASAGWVIIFGNHVDNHMSASDGRLSGEIGNLTP